MEDPVADHLEERDFGRLAALIERRVGIKMPPAKQLLMEGRLRRRIQALGLSSLTAYCRKLFDQGGLEAEFGHLVDAVTTNKTDFFREPQHFEFLVRHALPALAREGAGSTRPLAVWSCACSSGQEPYTLAMVLSEQAGLRFSIEASDIAADVLREAVRAVYRADAADPIPMELRRRYLLRSRDRAAGLVRVAPEIRRLVAFRQLNLLEGQYPWDHPMDVVFCRNVLIYFAKPTQQAVLEFLCRHLRPGGFLFLGHSETLAGLALPVQPVAPAVYRHVP